MRHLKKGRKFGRKHDQRKALLRSLIVAFFTHGTIKTTEAKAKEVKIVLEKLISRAHASSPLVRRQLERAVPASIVPKIVDRAKDARKNGGSIRIVKLGWRKSDSAAMALVELTR